MKIKTIKTAFIKTIPVMAGYIFLGSGFGILMKNAGYDILMSFIMSVIIFAGTGQYLGVSLLAGAASFLTTAITTFMVNARHIFYSISMIEKYKNTKPYKPYLIFGLTDETYSLLCDVKLSDDIDKNLFYFFVTLFNHCYWISGCVLGNAVSSHLPFSTTGIEFSMTALFVATFTEQWFTNKNHLPAIIGVFCSLICLLVFGKDNFLIPSMIIITFILSFIKPNMEVENA